MAEPLITAADVTSLTGEVFENDSPEFRQLQFFIRFASGKARQYVLKASGLSIDDGLGDGGLDRDLMTGIMVVVVTRALGVWRRGVGVKSRQFLEESTEYTDDANASSLIYFTADELDTLTPVADGQDTSDAFTITVGY